jgi:hypothetical protein
LLGENYTDCNISKLNAPIFKFMQAHVCDACLITSRLKLEE